MIAQLANFYSPTSGGLRVAVDRLGAGYRDAGHAAALIIPGASNVATSQRIEIASPRLPNGAGYRVIVSKRAVLDRLQTCAPDLIEVHDKLLLPWVSAWARPRGIPVLTVSHERLDVVLGQFAPWLPGAVVRPVTARLSRRVLRHSDVVVACSDFAAAEYGTAANVRRVGLGVDLEQFAPTGSGERRPGPVRLVCVSRLSAEKRPDIAIAALAEMINRGQPATLALLGSGPWESRLRRQARGLPVRFRGFVSRSEVADELRAADVALVPGPAETFGLGALEALACGTPIVVARGSGAAELVTSASAAGLASDLTGPAFAVAIDQVVHRPYGARSVAARAVAQSRGWDRTIARMLTIHAELLATTVPR